MAVKKTYHSAQGDKLHTVRSDDIIVLGQTDPTALEGYRTISAPMSDASKGVTNKIKAEGGAGIIQFAQNGGIAGNGTLDSPFTLDADYFNKNWVVNQFVNVTQIGNQSQQLLPIVKGVGYNLSFNNDILVYLGGLNLTFPAQTVDVRSQVSAPDNKTLLMYFTLVDNGLKLIITTTARAERYDSTYIGSVVMGSGSIFSIDAKPFMRLGNYRLSESIQGSAIPVSIDSPWVANYPTWGGKGTFIPINAGIDPTKYIGNVTFPATGDLGVVRIVQSGQFFIKDLTVALAVTGPYQQIYANGDATNSSILINGVNVWKGKGSSSNIYDRSSMLREGWNEISITSGELQIRGPFLK